MTFSDSKFNSWLTLNESTKISDYLKTLDKASVQAYKNVIRTKLNTIRNQNHLDAAVNYFTYLYISERVPLETVPAQIETDWGQFRAYISAALGNTQKSNFSLSSFDRTALETANAKFHRDLAARRGKRKGPQGQAVIKVDEALAEFKKNHPDINAGKSFLPAIWQGWSWVSLGCGESSEEAAAAGHCGNSGAVSGDNILSLRDNLNRVHLTFVVNIKTGTMGEAKAVDNNKPADSYHPAIVTLLLSGYVKKIDQTDTYMPENDFNVKDLKNARVKKVVEDHLGGVEDHKRPENYLPWSWLSQWDQAHVDGLTGKEKVHFLKETIKAIGNHDPFNSHDYNYETKEDEERYTLKPDWEMPQDLNFDLNQLALDCLNHINELKPVLAMLKDIHSVRNQLRGAGKGDWTTWFPEDEGKEDGDIDYDYDRPKMPSYDIDEVTINYYANKALDLAKGGSTRDKEGLIEELESIGYRDSGPPKHVELANRFSAEINQLTEEIIDEIIKRGYARQVEHSTVSSFVQGAIYPYELPNEPIPEEEDEHHGYIRQPRKLKNHIQNELSKDGRKLIGFFTYSTEGFSKLKPQKRYVPASATKIKRPDIPLTDSEKKFIEHIKGLHEKHLPLLRKRGYSRFLSKQREDGNIKYRFAEILKRQLIKMIVADVSKRIKQDLKGMAAPISKGEYSQGPEIKVFVPVADALKAARKGEAPAEFKTVDELLESLEATYFDRNLAKIEKWLLSNIDNVVAYTNGPRQKYVKGKGMVDVERDVQKTQHHQKRPRSFGEWAEKKDSGDDSD
tara:strand:+ start:389 stop:2761 length:2373 start_codon:yes stop_codon:yes gene_type:complete